MLLKHPLQWRQLMSQDSFEFDDEQSSSPHKLNLDEERRQSLVELMSNIVIHVFQLQENESDEQSQENQQN